MQSARHSCPFSIKLEFPQILEKYSNINFHGNPVEGEFFNAVRRTDTYEANSRFSQLCERT
jgi:hypothetical protein